MVGSGVEQLEQKIHLAVSEVTGECRQAALKALHIFDECCFLVVLLCHLQSESTLVPLEFEILGSMFEQRAPDRANKKYRLHLDMDL